MFLIQREGLSWVYILCVKGLVLKTLSIEEVVICPLTSPGARSPTSSRRAQPLISIPFLLSADPVSDRLQDSVWPWAAKHSFRISEGGLDFSSVNTCFPVSKVYGHQLLHLSQKLSSALSAPREDYALLGLLNSDLCLWMTLEISSQALRLLISI